MTPIRKTYTIFGLCLLSLSNVAATAGAGDGSLTLVEAYAALPSCAQSCMGSAIARSPCPLTDVSCICSDQKLNDAALACVRSSCTVRESLVTKNVTSHLCGLPIKTDSSLIPLYSVFVALAVIAVVLRLFARVLTQAYFWWDDLANLLSFVCAAIFTGFNIKAIEIGQGKEMWFVPFDNITTVVRMFFGDMLLYTVGRLFFRASILLFYLRVFPKADNRFNRLLVGTMIFNVIYNFSFIMAVVLQCQPLPYFWSQWEGAHEGHCGNYNVLAWVAATTGIVFDIWMLALPLSQLLALTLPWRKKLVGGLMFFFGIGVMVISLVRLKTINEFTQTVNPTKDIVQVCLWSGIELDVGVICPCLPSIRLLLRRLLPRLMVTTPSDTPSSAGYALDPALTCRSLTGTFFPERRRSSGARKGNGGGDDDGGNGVIKVGMTVIRGGGSGVDDGNDGNDRGCCCYVGAQRLKGKIFKEENGVSAKNISNRSSNGSISEQLDGWSSADEHGDLEGGKGKGRKERSR